MRYSFFSLKGNTVKERTIHVILLFFLFFLSVIILEYLKHAYSFGIPCIFREVTGLYCPGCGLTRGLESLIRLDIYQAFRYNVLLIPAVPLFIVCIIDQTVSYIRNKSTWFYHKIPNWIWISFLVIAIIFGILRNVPAFDFLVPTEV